MHQHFREHRNCVEKYSKATEKSCERKRGHFHIFSIASQYFWNLFLRLHYGRYISQNACAGKHIWVKIKALCQWMASVLLWCIRVDTLQVFILLGFTFYFVWQKNSFHLHVTWAGQKGRQWGKNYSVCFCHPPLFCCLPLDSRPRILFFTHGLLKDVVFSCLQSVVTLRLYDYVVHVWTKWSFMHLWFFYVQWALW